MHRERGYIYFQEFLPDNAFDTRITIIGDRAFGFMRANRPNDFRASGSGSIVYEHEKIDKRCIEIAFRVADRIGTQSLAFDFLFNSQHEPMIGEISYCYMSSAVHACEGHWDHQGAWHPGHIWPEEAILEDMLAVCRQKTQKALNSRIFGGRKVLTRSEAIKQVQRFALYLFFFSINFEVWDPFNTDGFFSVSKLTGLIYLFTIIPQIR